MGNLSIDWHSFLYGEEVPEFLFEVVIRTLTMFISLIICLRIMGRRAFMQGLFEVTLIIALGSATGDAMFYSKVGLLPTLLVLVIIVLIYRVINFLMSKSNYFEKIMEGKVFRIVYEGAFEYEALKKHKITNNEIFSDLRTHNVTHLGQIERAYIEPSGKISLFFYKENEIKFGLPIFPEMIEQKSSKIVEKGKYSCLRCGYTKNYSEPKEFKCEVCENRNCLPSINIPRNV